MNDASSSNFANVNNNGNANYNSASNTNNYVRPRFQEPAAKELRQFPWKDWLSFPLWVNIF